jgi:hypothetical protein
MYSGGQDNAGVRADAVSCEIVPGEEASRTVMAQNQRDEAFGTVALIHNSLVHEWSTAQSHCSPAFLESGGPPMPEDSGEECSVRSGLAWGFLHRSVSARPETSPPLCCSPERLFSNLINPDAVAFCAIEGEPCALDSIHESPVQGGASFLVSCVLSC